MRNPFAPPASTQTPQPSVDQLRQAWAAFHPAFTAVDALGHPIDPSILQQMNTTRALRDAGLLVTDGQRLAQGYAQTSHTSPIWG